VTEQYLQGLAQQVPGLKLADWMAARGDPRLAAQVNADGVAERASGPSDATPAFLLGGANATPLGRAIKKILPARA